MIRLILIRHGETIWNAAKRFQGQSDIELSEKGRWQAMKTGEHLRSEKIDAVYCSDLRRCVETAELIVRGRDLDVNLRSGLRELCFGEWEGLTSQEISMRSPGVLESMRVGSLDVRPPGGETWAEMRERVLLTFREIKQENDGRTVLVVAHINPVRVMLGEIIGSGHRSAFRFFIRNCAINIAKLNGDQSSLVVYNDTCHLEAR